MCGLIQPPIRGLIFSVLLIFKNETLALEYSSVARSLPGKYKALNSILSPKIKIKIKYLKSSVYNKAPSQNEKIKMCIFVSSLPQLSWLNPTYFGLSVISEIQIPQNKLCITFILLDCCGP